MARAEAAEGKKRTTLWGVIIATLGYAFWIAAYFPVWLMLFIFLVLFGWDTRSAETFWVIVLSIGAMPMTYIFSVAFTDFKEWAKGIDLFY